MRNMLAEFWTRWIKRISFPGNIAIWALASFGAAWAGPFGSYYGFDFLGALLFWGTIVGVSLILASVIMTIREVAYSDSNPALSEFASCVTFTVLFGPLVWVFTETINAANGGAPLSLFQCTLATFIVAVGIIILRLALRPSTVAAEELPADPPLRTAPAVRAPRLMRRLPDGDTGPILRLSGRDHFVEIVTPAGKHKVRMRLSDAVEEMDGVDGFFTHRSHWVAREAIKELKRSGSRHYVVAADAELIPVSRSNLPKLSEEGLLS